MASATRAAGLSAEWTPSLPFGIVAERAVGITKAKRTTEPGLIFWELGDRRWFADLTAGELVFEAPKSKLAKDILARVEASRAMLPADLSGHMEDAVASIGAVHLMGDLWLVPDCERAEQLKGLARGIAGASVAAIPLDGAEIAGEVLALMAGRLSAETERLTSMTEGLTAKGLRLRAGKLRAMAEDVARLATLYQTNLTILGEPLLSAEAKLLARAGGNRKYPPPLDFTGGAELIQAPYGPHTERIQSIETEVEDEDEEPEPIAAPPPITPVVKYSDMPRPPKRQARRIPVAVPKEGTYSLEGDPAPSVPPLLHVGEVEEP